MCSKSAAISIYMLHNLNELDLKPEAAGFDVVVYGHSHVAKAGNEEWSAVLQSRQRGAEEISVAGDRRDG